MRCGWLPAASIDVVAIGRGIGIGALILRINLARSALGDPFRHRNPHDLGSAPVGRGDIPVDLIHIFIRNGDGRATTARVQSF